MKLSLIKGKWTSLGFWIKKKIIYQDYLSIVFNLCWDHYKTEAHNSSPFSFCLLVLLTNVLLLFYLIFWFWAHTFFSFLPNHNIEIFAFPASLLFWANFDYLETILNYYSTHDVEATCKPVGVSKGRHQNSYSKFKNSRQRSLNF